MFKTFIHMFICSSFVFNIHSDEYGLLPRALGFFQDDLPTNLLNCSIVFYAQEFIEITESIFLLAHMYSCVFAMLLEVKQTFLL